MFSYIFRHKIVYFLLVPMTLYIIMVFIFPFDRKTNTNQKRTPSPTASAVKQSNPVINVNENAMVSLNDKLNNPQPLSQEDYAVRSKLLAKLNNATGTLYRTSSFRIDYLQSPDKFMVEIRDMNVGSAKQEATQWFLDQGMSKKGICNLPVIFYLNSDVAEELKPLHFVFNPVAENCQIN